MAGGAAGGFVTRAFESMLKECSGKKFTALQTTIQNYIDSTKETNQHSVSIEANQLSTLAAEQSLPEADAGVTTDDMQSDDTIAVLPTAGQGEESNKPVGTKGNIAAALATAGHTLEGSEAELVLNPLRLAFETKNIKILELALDCLHKLIAYEHLEGDPGLDGGKSGSLFMDILNMVCSCVDNSSSDNTILQVLKVLLTAVASTKFRVHGEPLLAVIRVCYNIALNSKSPINQATSKAMLTQMISIVFRRMETDQVSTASDSGTHGAAASEDSSNSIVEETALGDQNDNGTTLRDALSGDKVEGTSLASVEELQNLAGGADIKGLEAVLDKAVHLEDGEKQLGELTLRA